MKRNFSIRRDSITIYRILVFSDREKVYQLRCARVYDKLNDFKINKMKVR